MAATTTLESYAAARRDGPAEATIAVLRDVAAGVKAISRILPRAAVAGAIGRSDTGARRDGQQTEMDVVANELFLDAIGRSGRVAAVASEEMTEPFLFPGKAASSDLLLAIDPLDGSANLAVNVTVGTIFSFLRRPEGVAPGTEAFLQPGTSQLCAGYALYGPCTVLVVASGGRVDGFTLDPATGQFVLTDPAMQIPGEAREYAVNTSNARRWDPPVRRYVEECAAGSAGPRGVDFTMRWVGSTVADVHRVLLRGGLFLHPRDPRDPEAPARLRVLYEAAPLAFVVEAAGGAGSTGKARLLDVVPRSLHERTPVALGSRAEVARLAEYHREDDARSHDRPYTSPLFHARSLLRES